VPNSKQRKRKIKCRKLGGEVCRTGGVEVNHKMIQVGSNDDYFARTDCLLFDVLDLDLEKVMSPDEKQKLFDAIGYEGEDTSTSTYPEEV